MAVPFLVWRPPSYHRTAEGTAALYFPTSTTSGTSPNTLALRHSGTVDELSGDAILILFGAPLVTNDKDQALRATRMAAVMQRAVEALNAKWFRSGIDVVFKVRIGINTGVVTIGHFGSAERMKYAALGKHVNLAARLPAICETGKVLLSHTTWLLVRDQIPCEPKCETQRKDIQKPAMAHDVAGRP